MIDPSATVRITVRRTEEFEYTPTVAEIAEHANMTPEEVADQIESGDSEVVCQWIDDNWNSGTNTSMDDWEVIHTEID